MANKSSSSTSRIQPNKNGISPVAEEWHSELAQASQSIPPFSVAPSNILYRAERLRALKAAPYNAQLWLDYLNMLDEDRKSHLRANPDAQQQHTRMHEALQTLYNRATRQIPMVSSNRHSPSYLQLWLQNAALRAEDDPDRAYSVYKLMKNMRIGLDSSIFWNAWADLELRLNHPERASRFRHQASLCSLSSMSTPSRTNNGTTSNVALSSLRPKRNVPMRPARRVINPVSDATYGKESGVSAAGYATPTISEHSKTDVGENSVHSPVKSSVQRVPERTQLLSVQSTPSTQLPPVPSTPSARLPPVQSTPSSPAANPGKKSPSSSVQRVSESNRRPPVRPAPSHQHEKSEMKSPRVLQRETGVVQSPEVACSSAVSRRAHSPAPLLSSSEEKSIPRHTKKCEGAERHSERNRELSIENKKEIGGQQRTEHSRERESDSKPLREAPGSRPQTPFSQRNRERNLQQVDGMVQDRLNSRQQSLGVAYQRKREESHDTQSRTPAIPDSEKQRLPAKAKISPVPKPFVVAPPQGKTSNDAVLHRDQRSDSSSRSNSRVYSARHGTSDANGDSKRQDEKRYHALPVGADRPIAENVPSQAGKAALAGAAGHRGETRASERNTADSSSHKLIRFFRGVKCDDFVTVNGTEYLILNLVGKGGSSEVFKVLSNDMQIFALKRVKVPFSSSFRATIDSYANEIDLLRTLRDCPGIIQLFGAEVCLENGMIQLIMEYGDIDLAKRLFRNKRKKINHNFKRVYWQQMLEAVHTIHEARIIHGDLKPANFLIVEGTLKLIDFGIAKAIQTDDTTKIVRDSQVGTPNYMSPEALMCDDEGSDSEEESGPRLRRYKVGRGSDVWSLGCILYQMVYGRAPFAHIKNTMRKLQFIQNPNYEIPFPEVDDGAGVMEVLKGCLQRDPERRISIPDLLKHPFVSGKVGKRLRYSCGGEVVSSHEEIRTLYMQSLEKREYPSKPASKMSAEELLETQILALMTSGSGVEAGSYGQNFQTGQTGRGHVTPTVSAMTRSGMTSSAFTTVTKSNRNDSFI